MPALSLPLATPFCLEILEDLRGSCLRRLELGVLSAEQARTVLLERLSVKDVRLWTRNGPRCQLGNRIPASTEFLEAELRIAGCPLSAFGVPAEQELVMRLFTEDNIVELERTTVSLSASRTV